MGCSRTVAAVVVAAGLALAAAACGGSPPRHVAQLGTTTAQGRLSADGPAAPARANGWLAFSGCMRAHGVPRFPDPAAGGELPKLAPRQVGVSSTRFQAAETACRDLRPAGGSLVQESGCLQLGDCPAPEVRRIRTAELGYARCMRAHGVPDWPDPTLNSQGMPVFDVTRAGIDRRFTHSPLYRTLNGRCQRLTGGAPVPRQ